MPAVSLAIRHLRENLGDPRLIKTHNKGLAQFPAFVATEVVRWKSAAQQAGIAAN